MKGWFLAVLWLLSTQTQATVGVTGRQLLIAEGGVDTVWGSYVFMVKNDGKEPEAAAIPLRLPKETTDWVVQEGATPQDLKLASEGGLKLEKTFQPGDQLVVIGFKVPAEKGAAKMNWALSQEAPELSILTPLGTILAATEGGEVEAEVDFSKAKFRSISLRHVKSDVPVLIEFSEIPEGRGAIQKIAWGFALLLAFSSILLTWRSRKLGRV